MVSLEGRHIRTTNCDLLDHDQTVEKLSPLAGQVTHLFWVTWASQFPIDTPECFVQNWTMLSNTLNALLNVPLHTLRHVSLQTGTKHYVSLEAPGLNGPYIEEDKNGQTELENDGNTNNFYHAMEILVTEQARRGIISWSVHRPGLLLGASERSFFNIVGTLCVYASLCQHINMPFYFYGTKFCWEEQYIDMSDARLVASQHIWWASLSPLLGKGEAFNTIDSTPFIWKEVWPELASKFGFEKTEETNWVSDERRYSEIMNDKEELWEEIIDKNGLRKTKIEELVNWEFLDSLFRFPGKLMASSEKAKHFGFEPACDYTAIDSVLYWVDCMREMRLIP
ncbi:hypothetical protein LUZ60_007465 [Juncus effusus]|nr:hypothetical protein LUZ60_007465 [Juncus effusus]